ncbi:disulfide isomerase DsbC N-terminal domain-containing protein [Desulfurobacterium atlanticum]|nr:disulfide isomerase DsbC N-terminal domain-containing protein [Desulfurobacterium atlanticum]
MVKFFIMKLILKVILFFTAVTVSAYGKGCPKIGDVEKQLLLTFRKPIKVKAVYPIGIDGFCRVITQEGNFFIDEKARYLIQGLIFKLPDRKIDKEFMNFLEKSVSFEAGEGKRYVYVIVDPECEACRKSSKKMKLFFENGIKLKFILAPFSSKEAEEKAIKFICSHGNIKNFMEGNYRGKVCTSGKLKVWSTMDKLKARGLTSTPVFITENGNVYFGENSVKEVIKEYEKKEGAKPQN